MSPFEGSETIQETAAKSKAFLDSWMAEWGLFLLITLAVVAAFGLGRLSALIEAKPLIELRRAAAGAGEALAPGGLYVASRTGLVYYFPWCAGAKNIAPQNERWFVSAEAAEKAGYRPAKNCKGLVGE